MKQFFQLREYNYQSQGVNSFRYQLDDYLFLHTILSPEKSENPTIQHLLYVNVLEGFEMVNQKLKEQQSSMQNQRPGQSYQQADLRLLHQDISNSGSYKSETEINFNSEEEGSKNKEIIQNTQKAEKKSKRIKNQQKNQYDKNIPGHIVSTIVRQILKPAHKKQIQFYCSKMKSLSQNQPVTYQKVIDFAKRVIERSKKFGTSQLGHFFREKNPENDLQKVFGLFMIRFLRQQYILHILRVGKMSNKQKYLECATNMMYIPKFRQQEYQLIHRFQRKDV